MAKTKIYTNITSATTTDLIAKDGQVGGGISKISISNHSDSNACTIDVFLEDATASASTNAGNVKYHFINAVIIPTGASLVLDDNLGFDSTLYNLRITTVGTSPLICVIIS